MAPRLGAAVLLDNSEGLIPIQSCLVLDRQTSEACQMPENPIFTARRGVAQPGSASALGAEGRWFESGRPDQSLFVELTETAVCGYRFV